MALSVVITRRSYWPAVSPVVFQGLEYGPVVSVPIVVHVFAPCGLYWNWAEATPDPVSAELELTVTVP